MRCVRALFDEAQECDREFLFGRNLFVGKSGRENNVRLFASKKQSQGEREHGERDGQCREQTDGDDFDKKIHVAPNHRIPAARGPQLAVRPVRGPWVAGFGAACPLRSVTCTRLFGCKSG